MNKENSNFYLPTYMGILPCCGNELVCEVEGKYPDATERVNCSRCKAAYNARFFLNENGVMMLEMLPIKL